MRVRIYNQPTNSMARDWAAWNNLMNRWFDRGWTSYDYAGNGGQTGSAAESNGHEESPRAMRLPLDVWATPESFKIAAYVPGVNPEDVEITFEGDELTIRGELPAAEESGEALRSELYHGRFERRLTFNADGIEAHFSNGLLTLVVPKAEAVRPKQIKVQVK